MLASLERNWGASPWHTAMQGHKKLKRERKRLVSCTVFLAPIVVRTSPPASPNVPFVTRDSAFHIRQLRRQFQPSPCRESGWCLHQILRRITQLVKSGVAVEKLPLKAPAVANSFIRNTLSNFTL